MSDTTGADDILGPLTAVHRAGEVVRLLGEATDTMGKRPPKQKVKPWALKPARGHILDAPDDSFRWLLDELGTAGLSELFWRGGSVVRAVRVGEEGYKPPADGRDDDGPSQVVPVTFDVLVGRLVLTGYKILIPTPWGGEPALFPGYIAKLVLISACHGDAPHLRRLDGVTHSPLVRADGSVLSEPGYDAATGYLFLPDVEVPSWWQGKITPALVKRATELIRGLVDQFPWVTEHDEATWLGLLVLPILRDLAPPPYRAGMIGAHQPGSGKTLLARTIRLVHGGVFRTELPHDDAELQKSIVGILTRTTGPVVTFDNVTGIVKSSRLAGLFTANKSDPLSDRVLGSTNETTMTNDRLWLFTANNLVLGGDLVRRSVWCTIDPRMPHPEQRDDFKIPNLAEHVQRNRGEILAALLVWVRAWVAKGRPLGRRPSDDYGHSTAVVRAILETACVPGVFDHKDTRQQTVGSDDAEWSEFLEAVYAAFGEKVWTVKELLAAVVNDSIESAAAGDMLPRTRDKIPLDSLPGELVEKVRKASYGDQIDVRVINKALGWWLRNRRGRFSGDLRCQDMGKKDHSAANRWRVERVDRPAPPPTPADWM